MAFDWLRSLRSKTSRRRSRSAVDAGLGHLTSLELRLLPAAAPVGPEFQVNTYTTGDQLNTAIAMDSQGNYVIAWQSSGQDGGSYGGTGIYAQRYNAAGVPQGSEIHVNTFTDGAQEFPAVAMDDDGDFVIAWQSEDQAGIIAQRFNAAGVPQGTEIQVNSTLNGSEWYPTVAMDDVGDFVIAWQGNEQAGFSTGIYARRFNAAGVPQGNDLHVNTHTTGYQMTPTLGMDSDGDFAIAWASQSQDGSSDGVYAQRFNAAGTPQGAEFRANTYTTNYQRSPSLAMDDSGDFVIAWESNGQDGEGSGIYAQRYNAAGTPQGSEFRLNLDTTSGQRLPVIAMDADGNFVATWESDDGIFARRFNAAGTPLENEFQVNTHTVVSYPAITSDADGDFVVSWQSYDQDGEGSGIYARGYRSGQPDSVGVKRGSSFYLDSNHSQTWNGSTTDTFASFGNDSDKPVVGDWNGDGYDDIGIWRNGVFYLDANGNGSWDGPATDRQFAFGNPTDTPLAGDWNGDGTDEIGVWRAGRFYLDFNANRVWNVGVDITFVFGNPTDTPLVGDWNGDGTDDIGIWRAGYFYRDANGNRVWNSGIDSVINFGNVTDTPLIGDWNGDGTDEIGIWRAGDFYQDSNGNGVWNPGTDTVANFGNSTDTPLIGNWRSNTVAANPPPSLLSDVSTFSAEVFVSPVRSSFPVDGLASLLSIPAKKRVS